MGHKLIKPFCCCANDTILEITIPEEVFDVRGAVDLNCFDDAVVTTCFA